MKTFAALLLCVFALSSCATLDKSGVYAGDDVLYQTELTTTTSYELIHSYVTWEKANRATLAKWPEIKQSADAMRQGAPQWFATAYALRDAYAADPTDANRAALERSLNVLRTALNEAVKYMAQTAGSQ